MNKVIILDTNFLISNKGKVKDIVSKIEEQGFMVYVPQIAKEEFINIQLRKIKQDYKQIENLNNNKPYLKLTYESEANVLKLHEKGYEKSFKEYFKDHIIPYDKNTILVDVLKRNKYKEPPFYDEPGSSDKGFKDTIMWLSIKNFIETQEEETTFFFITSDNGFIKYQQQLEREITNKTLKIVDIKDVEKLYELLDIGTINEKSNENIFIATKDDTFDITMVRDKINDIMDNINNFEVEDWNGEIYKKNRFKIYKYLTYEKTEKFLNNIPNVLNENIFRKKICLESFFEYEDQLYSENVDIEIEIIEELSNLYISVKNTSYKDSFINFVMQKLNENKESKQIDDDLPF